MRDMIEKTSLKARVFQWSEKLDVRVTMVSVRPMRRKWASCSTAGNLSLSTDLLSLEDEVVDYVIVHELLHLAAQNHGRLWKSLMRVHLGDYEAIDRRLREIAGLELRADAIGRG
jgi:predicted metal-dependent hydrolase